MVKRRQKKENYLTGLSEQIYTNIGGQDRLENKYIVNKNLLY